MNIRVLQTLLIFCITTHFAHAAETYTLTGPEGKTAEGQLHHIEVTENRLAKNSQQIRLGFVVLPQQQRQRGANARKPNPIVYLSGGPGGSATWTARGPRFPLFVAMTEIADVVLFDQRGTGLSRNHLSDCTFQHDIANEQPLTQKDFLRNMTQAASFCAAQWRSAGIDLNAYNTVASVEDLEDLRKALGVEKIDLWAISYGTHLALAMAKKYPDSIGRMVLASAEGLDETIKLPSLSDAQLQRIAAEIAADEGARQKYPDLLKLMRDTLASYEKEPLVIDAKSPQTGETTKLGIGAFDIQLMTAGYMTGDREAIAMLPAFYQLLQQRDPASISQYTADKFLGMRHGLWTLNPMSMAMDAASGISAKRWQQVQTQEQTAILGRAHNLPFPDVNTALGVADLGDAFRAPLSGDIPTLLFSGSLDGRTFVESHRAIAERLSNAVLVNVERGGHNLFMSSPQIAATIKAFYQGKPITERHIELDPIAFF